MDDEFFRPILFLFPSVLKENVSSKIDIENWRKDYLSKNKNIEKYIYDACESLQICGISYTKYKKELEQYSNDQLNNGVGEIVGRNFEIEARLMLRRILELFVETIHFEKINNEKEKTFRHFFLLRNLKAFYSRKTNTKEFCDFNLEFDNKAVFEIRRELNNISIQDVFYLFNNKSFNKDGDIKNLFKSFRKLLEESILGMTDGLREMVGESYQLYAETSDVIHGFSGGPNFNLRNYHQEVTALYARVSVLASNILKNLVSIGEKQIDNTDIKEAIKGLKTDNLPQNYKFAVGDKVLVLRQIKAQILEISQSKYGCKKYKVRYDDKCGDFDWSFEREWFLLRELKKI